LQDDKYVTGLLLMHSGKGRFVFAGAHEWPLIWRKRTRATELVEAPGPWLGVLPELEDIPVSSLVLDQGDILCLYSDGVIEARNSAGELYDVERLRFEVARAAQETTDLSRMADMVMESVAQFAHQREDDWTLVLVRRLVGQS
jgi:serine phosphatase RsbU (regulator of sigma subunit)